MCFEGVGAASDADVCKTLALEISGAALSVQVGENRVLIVRLTVTSPQIALAAAAMVLQLRTPLWTLVEK